MPNTESGKLVLTPLERVRAAARKDKDLQFTSLLHHVNRHTLKAAYESLKRSAAPGVDRITWYEYGMDLESNLKDLQGRIHRGGFRAKPSKRVYIEKENGQKRPLGISSLEDKIVQATITKILNAIYEVDFTGFSYGFRPGRSQHNALDALAVSITGKKVGWVLDADVSGYFDAINHEYLMDMLKHRIGDKRVLRLIKKWLNAGVLEDGYVLRKTNGTPQGANISPLLANIYLHYVFDLWAHNWRHKRAQGTITMVRYADDFVVGFQYRDKATQFLYELRKRFAKFDLKLHPDKTRLIEFGRFAESNRKERGQGRPETFSFLGFTHICGKDRRKKFMLRRHTITKRLRAKLAEVKVKLRKRMHQPIDKVGKWLRMVVNGYFNYHAVPTNRKALVAFRREIERSWLRTCRKRSQRDHMTWKTFKKRIEHWLPEVNYRHPWPNERLGKRYYSR